LSSQVLTQQQDAALDSWIRLIRGYASVTRAMSAELEAEHGLTINDYEALLHLSRAEEGRMRRVDLAGRLLLTASGVTRLLDGLEAAGLVERASCPSDRRVTYAVVTDAGRTRLHEASVSHIAGVREFFEARYSGEELEQLAGLLGRLPGATDSTHEDCSA
jgi:DNA-binding MarR family transcriptional regulator